MSKMEDVEKQLQELDSKLDQLRGYQQRMQQEILRIEQSLQQLRAKSAAPISNPGVSNTKPVTEPSLPLESKPAAAEPLPPGSSLHRHASVENFIGTNLISKVGILITIIGVFVGARYAVDRQLISPSMRIILAYVFALALAVTGLRLKKRYVPFSAVLMGGSIAIIYFSTYIGYDYYRLMPQLAAFALMFLTTLAAVAVALWYDQKIVALIGQVAAYAIPVLLSDGSGRIAIMFGYITIINAGLMVLSFMKNWKIIYRVAFSISWAIYFSWIQFGVEAKLSWSMTLMFLTLCFLTFYITYLSYKIIRKELYNVGEITVLLLNALFYFALGYILIDRKFEDTNALTGFTLLNAAIHLAAGYGIHRLKLADTSVRLFLLGQGLAFVTIAIPVKLDGSWVTLLWATEAAILIYTAGQSGRKLYYQLAAFVQGITLISLIQDWGSTYIDNGTVFYPFFNQTFFASCITAGCFLYASMRVGTGTHPLPEKSLLKKVFSDWSPLIVVLVTYFGIYLETDLFFDHTGASNTRTLWMEQLHLPVLYLYSIVFVSTGIFINNRFIRDARLAIFFMISAAIVIITQLTAGLHALGALRFTSFVWWRYLDFAAILFLWLNLWRSRALLPPTNTMAMWLTLAFHVTLLTIVSNEYIHWVSLLGYSTQYKLGLSIVFGGYALVILFRGLVRNIKYLRIAAISLFGCAVVKLFAYDLRAVSTIGKAVVLVVLGILLLAASFLYTKYIKGTVAQGDARS